MHELPSGSLILSGSQKLRVRSTWRVVLRLALFVDDRSHPRHGSLAGQLDGMVYCPSILRVVAQSVVVRAPGLCRPAARGGYASINRVCVEEGSFVVTSLGHGEHGGLPAFLGCAILCDFVQ
jgi:hypothetical protein